jgi:hypothetical protein
MYTNKLRLSIEDARRKVIELKSTFDKIKDYNKKLEFWYNNGFDIGTFTYSSVDPFEKKDINEKKISIYPQNTDEIKAFKRFYFNAFHKDNFNTLETSKAKYWESIKNGANSTAYTKKIIAEIEKEYESNNKFKDTGQNSLRSYCNGYDASENGQIETFLNNGSFHDNLLVFFTGEVHEKYKRFLVEHLEKLETGKRIKFTNAEKLNISCKLIGENNSNTIQLVYHHIKDVLNVFNITPLQAIDILSDLEGANSPAMNKNVVEPIRKHLERLSTVIYQPERIEFQEIPEKDIRKNIEEKFSFIAYFNQYELEGIRFDFHIKNEGVISAVQSDGSTINFISQYSVNKEVNEEMTERFYQRRWKGRERLFSEHDFIEDELKTLSQFHERLQKEFEAQFYPLRKLLKEKLLKFENKSDKKEQTSNTNSESIKEVYDQRIFTSQRGAKIFDKLIEARTKSRNNDYCVFIYRQLIKDGFMVDIKQATFKEFMNEKYSINLDKFKHLDIVSKKERLELYFMIRNSIKVTN